MARGSRKSSTPTIGRRWPCKRGRIVLCWRPAGQPAKNLRNNKNSMNHIIMQANNKSNLSHDPHRSSKPSDKNMNLVQRTKWVIIN